MFRWVYRKLEEDAELNGAIPIAGTDIVQVLQIEMPASIAQPNKLSLVGVDVEQENVWVDMPCHGFEVNDD